MTPFVPSFTKAVGYSADGTRFLANDVYYADQATAQWIANRWGTGQVREVAALGAGPFAIDTKMIEIELKTGGWVNAGMLAAYYDRNSETLFPGVAEALISAVLGIAAPPPLPSVLTPAPTPVKPTPTNAVVGKRTAFGTYPAYGDPNPKGKVIDNPFLPGDEKLIKRIEDVGPFGADQFWEDAPAGAVLN